LYAAPAGAKLPILRGQPRFRPRVPSVLKSEQTLLALILLGIVNHVVLGGSRVAVSLKALSLGASTFTVGLLMALYALLPMLLAVTAGRWADVFGARRPMTIGTVAIAIAALIPWLADGLAPLFFNAALLGVGFMMCHVAAQHATGALGGAEVRARNFSMLAVGNSISGFLGPLVAGFAIDHGGFAVAFAVFAVLPFVSLAGLASRRLQLIGPHPVAAAGGSGSALQLLLDHNLRAIFVMNALVAIAWDLHMIFVPIYGARIGFTASQIGALLASFAAATFVIRFAIPRVTRRYSEHSVLTATLFIAGFVFVALPFATDFVVLLALSFCLGLGLGAGQPMVLSLLHEHAPPERVGEAAGVRMSLVQTMAVSVPLAFGALGSALGIAPVLWAVGAGLTASGGFFLRRGAR
jgi:MFS family permease